MALAFFSNIDHRQGSSYDKIKSHMNYWSNLHNIYKNRIRKQFIKFYLLTFCVINFCLVHVVVRYVLHKMLLRGSSKETCKCCWIIRIYHNVQTTNNILILVKGIRIYISLYSLVCWRVYLQWIFLTPSLCTHYCTHAFAVFVCQFSHPGIFHGIGHNAYICTQLLRVPLYKGCRYTTVSILQGSTLKWGQIGLHNITNL